MSSEDHRMEILTNDEIQLIMRQLFDAFTVLPGADEADVLLEILDTDVWIAKADNRKDLAVLGLKIRSLLTVSKAFEGAFGAMTRAADDVEEMPGGELDGGLIPEAIKLVRAIKEGIGK